MSAHDLAPGSLYAAFAVTSGLAWLVSGRRRGPLSIGGGLLAVQTALHLIFSSGEPHGGEQHGGAAHTGADHGSLGHASMGDASMSHTSLGHASMADPSANPVFDMAGGHTSVGMLAAHVLAAVVCGLWLARGEAALFALGRAVGALAFTPLRLLLAVAHLPSPQPAPLVRTRPRPRGLCGVVLAHALSRRGPPRLSATRATALGAHV
ncbi:hypothetical protein [Streptomyces sp. NPDC093600]|uniref:hypothetical protein n=1 Tax=Streptomyces sp. NPDC093600 TaxID=3366047 RepID=UPI00381CBD05